jgi:hypothetical protein
LQSETQRPFCCAQAPDIVAFVAFACFAANAGDVNAAARAARNITVATDLFVIEKPFHIPSRKRN